MEFTHIPVLLNETVDSLHINPDGIYVDGTAGGAGHSTEIAKKLKNGQNEAKCIMCNYCGLVIEKEPTRCLYGRVK